jgi:hypothetical protein
MPENTGNEQGNAQENSGNSENVQTELENNTDVGDTNSEGEANDTEMGGDDDNSEDDGGLPLPKPDVAEDESKKKKEPPEWLKKKLQREKLAAEAKDVEAAQLREENARLRQGNQPPANQPAAPQPNFDPHMPQREQFNSDGEYFFALGDYRDARRHQEAQFHQRQAAIKKHEEAFHNNLKDAVETGRNKYKDFEEKTDYILYGDGFPSNRAMAEAIVESEYKDDILYYLGTHVKEAERIASLNPVSAAKEIAKIEVRLDSRKKSNITKAPKVLTPLTGGKGSATHGDPNKMGMDEFRQWYKDKYG